MGRKEMGAQRRKCEPIGKKEMGARGKEGDGSPEMPATRCEPGAHNEARRRRKGSAQEDKRHKRTSGTRGAHNKTRRRNECSQRIECNGVKEERVKRTEERPKRKEEKRALRERRRGGWRSEESPTTSIAHQRAQERGGQEEGRGGGGSGVSGRKVKRT
jgi:hypothetical protein